MTDELILNEYPEYFQWTDVNGAPHSPDNETPALWAKDGTFKMWYHHGMFHRMYGLPAVIYARDAEDDRNEYWFMGWRHRYIQYGPAMEFLRQPENSIWFQWERRYDENGVEIELPYEVSDPTFLGDYTDDQLGKNGAIYPTPTPTASPVVEPEPTPEPTVAAAKKSRKTS